MSKADSDGDILHFYHLCPIGTIVAWLKNYTNTPSLPEGWVECNGQVINDAESPYNGQTAPNLNGNNRFLRGNTTSGGTGGSETHSHGRTTGGNLSDDIHTTAMTTVNHLPPYYNVVWIMRIK